MKLSNRRRNKMAAAFGILLLTGAVGLNLLSWHLCGFLGTRTDAVPLPECEIMYDDAGSYDGTEDDAAPTVTYEEDVTSSDDDTRTDYFDLLYGDQLATTTSGPDPLLGGDWTSGGGQTISNLVDPFGIQDGGSAMTSSYGDLSDYEIADHRAPVVYDDDYFPYVTRERRQPQYDVGSSEADQCGLELAPRWVRLMMVIGSVLEGAILLISLLLLLIMTSLSTARIKLLLVAHIASSLVMLGGVASHMTFVLRSTAPDEFPHDDVLMSSSFLLFLASWILFLASGTPLLLLLIVRSSSREDALSGGKSEKLAYLPIV